MCFVIPVRVMCTAFMRPPLALAPGSFFRKAPEVLWKSALGFFAALPLASQSPVLVPFHAPLGVSNGERGVTD